MDFVVRLVQNFPRLGDVDENFQYHRQEIEKAIKDKVDLIVFPELSLTGYLLKDMVRLLLFIRSILSFQS